jgi:hypothetical protein
MTGPAEPKVPAEVVALINRSQATPSDAPPRAGTAPTANPSHPPNKVPATDPTSDNRAQDFAHVISGNGLDDLVQIGDLTIGDEHTIRRYLYVLLRNAPAFCAATR